MLVSQQLTETPTPEPINGTLLDVAPATDRGGEWFDPKGLYQSVNCITTDVATAICPDPRGAKDFDLNGPKTIDGILVAVYTPFKCKIVGTDFDSWQAKVAAAIERKEYLALEKLLVNTRFTGGQGGPKANVITGPATPTPAQGLAYLEQNLSENYSGKGVIHMSRVLASLLTGNGVLSLEGKKLVSALGTPVAAGGGAHPGVNPVDGTAPTAGQFWMYASGGINISRSPLRAMKEVDRVNNDGVILFERLYEIVVDCYVSAMKVSI